MAANRLPGQNNPEPLGGNPELAFVSGHDEGVQALHELGVHRVQHDSPRGSLNSHDEKSPATEEKNINDEIRHVADDEEGLPIGKGMTASEKVENMEEIALYALHVEDDPSLNPWTFRVAFLGEPLPTPLGTPALEKRCQSNPLS